MMKKEKNKKIAKDEEKFVSEESFSPKSDEEVSNLLKEEINAKHDDSESIINSELNADKEKPKKKKKEKKEKPKKEKQNKKEEKKNEKGSEVQEDSNKDTTEEKQSDNKEHKEEKAPTLKKKDNKKKEKQEEFDPAKDAFASEDEKKPTDIPDAPKKQTIEDLAENTSGPAKKYAIARVEAQKEKKKKIIIACVTVGVCILSILAAWLFSFLNTSFEDDDFKIKDELTETSFHEPFYMLLVGTDTREGKSYKLSDGRSDSCILVRIDPINYVVTMISIPRDTKITVDGYTQKFNATYAAGGIKATIKQVKEMMGVDISHYAEISFNGLTDMVDAVGGVEVDVPQAISDPNVDVYVPAGRQTLNGVQALSFSRSRHFGDGDFTRSADQRVLIEALINKAYHTDISELPNILRAAKNFVKTDLRLGDMIGLATQFMTADQEMKIYSAMVPSTTSSEDGVSYVLTDKSALKRMMKMVENGEDPLMVEIDSGASVCSSRDAADLEKRRKEYYEQHPDSPGRISNSSY